MRQLEHSDWREQERGRQPPTKQLERRVTLGDIPQCPQDDRDAFKRAPVCSHRLLGASAASDVCKGLGTQYRLRPLLESRHVERDARAATSCSGEVYLCLTLAPS